MIRAINYKLNLKNDRKFKFLFRSFSLKKKFILKIIIVIMIINIVISMAILKQQTTINLFFSNYNRIELSYDTDTLLNTLNAYRSSNHGNEFEYRLKNNHKKKIKKEIIKPVNITFDYLFNKISVENLSSKNDKNHLKSKNFYEPRILIENKRACSSKNNGKVFMICLIHSHKNNYLRRKTMRDTWLTLDTISILVAANKNQTSNSAKINFTNLELVHLFLIGNDDKPETFDQISLESNMFNDIIMIDTIDTYKNLLYKHLAIVNWIIENCPHATYVLKLDDDVFVNIKSLSSHLIQKFGPKPIDSKFIYCNINELTHPIRDNTSKWYVDHESYPFRTYPKYCEGFAYITNVATIRLMQQQSRIIPRFWIDDVYFTGLLLYGFDQVKWFDFKDFLKWSYYDFWDLGNTLSIYEFYAKFLSLFNVNAFDYYLSDYFVILHSQSDNKEINYESGNSIDARNNQTESDKCRNNLKISDCGFYFSSLYFNDNTNTRLLYEHFYNFCSKLWQKKIS